MVVAYKLTNKAMGQSRQPRGRPRFIYSLIFVSQGKEEDFFHKLVLEQLAMFSKREI